MLCFFAELTKLIYFTVGAGCFWEETSATTHAHDYNTFAAYKATLNIQCDSGDAANLTVTPDSTWPDDLYYQVSVLHISVCLLCLTKISYLVWSTFENKGCIFSRPNFALTYIIRYMGVINVANFILHPHKF